jgi:hypothetical protein
MVRIKFRDASERIENCNFYDAEASWEECWHQIETMVSISSFIQKAQVLSSRSIFQDAFYYGRVHEENESNLIFRNHPAVSNF